MTTADRGRGRGTVLLVCRANLIRSPLAAGMLRRHLADRGGVPVTVRSAGLRATRGAVPPDDVVRVARRWGVDLAPHRAVAVGAGLLSDATVVVTMTEDQRSGVTRSAPWLTPRTFTLRELVRLLGGHDPAGADSGRGLAERAHRQRPLATGAPAPEDVRDPVGLGDGVHEEVAEDLDALCRQLAPWFGGDGA